MIGGNSISRLRLQGMTESEVSDWDSCNVDHMQNMGAFPGKSDCLVLPKNLALCRKPEEKHYEFGHQVAKTP